VTTRFDLINARAFDQSLFHRGQPVAAALRQCAAQYAAHFGPGWLFVRGADSALTGVPYVGQLNWYMLLFLPAGLVAVVSAWRRHRAYRLLVAWLLLHPIASATTESGPHALRAACGIPAFSWLGAVGVVALYRRVGRRETRQAAVTVVAALIVAINAGWALRWYYRAFARNIEMGHFAQADLCDAVEVIRPIWRQYDRIFVSDHVSDVHNWQSDHPYILLLALLPVEPETFHDWDKEVDYLDEAAPFHRVRAMGPFILSTGSEVLARHFREHPDQKVLIVARPGDVGGGRTLHVVFDRGGEPRFEIIEVAPPRAGGP
jgi:hypothetical protein